LLEPCAGKLARTVLRGAWGREAPCLPDRDVRMIKLQDKISGGWASPTSAQAWASTRSYIQTARKHGINPYTAIRQALTEGPWLPPAPA